MTKEEVLANLKQLVERGEIGREELLDAAGFADQLGEMPPVKKEEHRIDIAKILYGIGGLIVIAGVVFLIQQMWDSFGAAAQILATLGSAMAIYISAVLLQQYPKTRLVSLVLFVVAGVLLPVGIFVTLHNLSPGGNEWLGQLIIAGIPALVYFATYHLFKNKLLFLMAVLFATWAIYTLVGLMLDGAYLNNDTRGEIWAYLTLLVGTAYILLGYGGENEASDKVTGIYYLLGAGGVLGAGFALTFMRDSWIMVYFLLILAAIYMSTFLRSRAFLIFGALALMGHLTHISWEYFADSFGWGLALIFSGFLIIGIGYGTVALHQRFIQQKGAP